MNPETKEPTMNDTMQTATLTMPVYRLRALLEHMRRHASQDETRPYLTGVAIESSDGEVRFTATDGHRLLREATRDRAPC